MREDGAAQSSQPSQLPQERSSDPAFNVYYQDTSHGASEFHPIVYGRPRRAAPKGRVIAQARIPVGELEQWFAYFCNDVQNSGLDSEVVHQRITQFLA